MNRFEKKLKKLSKKSNPKAEEWREAHLNQTQPVVRDHTSALKIAIISSATPLALLLCAIVVWVISSSFNTAPLQKPQYGEQDLYYSEISERQLKELDIYLPDYSALNELTFMGAYVTQTDELGYIRLSGRYENETQYIEYSIIILLMDNVHFLTRNNFETICTEKKLVNDYVFLFSKMAQVDDIFFNAKAYSDIEFKRYYIDLVSLDKITPSDLVGLFC